MLLFQEQIQTPENASIARFQGLGCYQTHSEKQHKTTRQTAHAFQAASHDVTECAPPFSPEYSPAALARLLLPACPSAQPPHRPRLVVNPLFSPSSASRQPAALPFSAQAAGSARIHLRPRAARLLRCWLAALAGLLAAAAALLLLTWALLRAALAPQADEWALALGSGPGAFRASVMQLAWLGTSPWLGP